MLLETYGMSGRLYASGAAFLADLPGKHGCLLVDVDMPKMNGLELLDRLRGRGIAMPVIIMAGALTARITGGGGSNWGSATTKAAPTGRNDRLYRKGFRPLSALSWVITAI